MPYDVTRNTDRCPMDRPWAVENPDSGRLHGCHETEQMAQRQQAALYANVEEASATPDVPRQAVESKSMRRKTFEVVETKTDEEAGTFTALASVFGNVDKGGDRMLPGSFSKTLDKWRESGKAIPVILSHQWDDLTAWVGKADPRAIFEDDRGLTVQGQLFMDEDSGRKVHKLMREGLLTGWSFGYSVPKGGQKHKNGANEISEVELFEVGPTLIGMNELAQLQDVKSAERAELQPDMTISEEEFKAAVRTVEDATNRRLTDFLTDPAIPEQDGPNEEPSTVKSRPDALKDRSLAASLDVLSDGVVLANPEPPPKPNPELEDEALLKRARSAVLDVLSEGAISQ